METYNLQYGADILANDQPWDFVYDNHPYDFDYSWLSAAPYAAIGEYVYTDVTQTITDASIINAIFDAGFRPEDMGYYILPATDIIA